MSHLRIHARCRHDRPRAAIGDAAAEIDHIRPVSERDIRAERAGLLCHRNALTSERRLLRFQTGAFDNACISRHCVARFEQYDIAGDQLLAGYDRHCAAAQHAALRGRELLQRFNRLFRLALLKHAERRIDQHDDENDTHIRKALACVKRRDARHQRRRKQDKDHGVRHLREKALDERILLRLLQPVSSVALQPARRFVRLQAVRAAVQFLKHRVFRFQIVLDRRFLLSNCPF